VKPHETAPARGFQQNGWRKIGSLHLVLHLIPFLSVFGALLKIAVDVKFVRGHYDKGMLIFAGSAANCVRQPTWSAVLAEGVLAQRHGYPRWAQDKLVVLLRKEGRSVSTSMDSARIAREEIFGPVVSVIPFENEAEAIRISNDTPYGLAEAVWTRDIYKAFRVVQSIRAGIVWVNHMQPTCVEAPWGGYKQSGFGRELGPWGLEEYLETKQVFVNLDETPIGWY